MAPFALLMVKKRSLALLISSISSRRVFRLKVNVPLCLPIIFCIKHFPESQTLAKSTNLKEIAHLDGLCKARDVYKNARLK
jgi:hypothetical protein